MANIAPANFAYVNANGDKGDVQVLSDADITLLNEGLQDIEDLKLAIQKPLPAGTIIPFAGNVVPEGFLICNGAAVSRTTYASLFAAIGTLYGTGDGSTTFNLPDARDRVLQGASGTHLTGSYISAGLPNIYGDLRGSFAHTATDAASEGATFWYYGDHRNPTGYVASTRDYNLQFATVAANGNPADFILNASLSNSLYGSSTTVQPNATAVQYLIKY